MKVQKSLVRLMLLVLPLMLLSPPGWGQEEEVTQEVAEETTEEAPEEEGEQPSSIYLPLKPPFVVNYGGGSGENNSGKNIINGRLHYLKAELTVRVGSAQDVNSIRHHMPYIRNQLILLFSKQTQESLETQEGKELLRQKAFTAIQELIVAEDGELDLIGVYFNQFIIQN